MTPPRLSPADLAAAGYVRWVHGSVAAHLAAAGFDVELVDQADVEARAAAERAQTVELGCFRCRHPYRRHDPAGCLTVMRDDDLCGCPGFQWVDPAGRSGDYSDAPA